MTAISANHSDATHRAPSKRWDYFKLFGMLVKDGLVANEIFTRSAALAYNTLFSLLPTMVLCLIVVSMFSSRAGDSGSMGKQLQTWLLNQSGLEQIQLSAPATEGGSEGHRAETLDTFLTKTIDKMQGIVQSPGTGIIGFATLLYGALNLMLVIERAFNHVYLWPQARPWTRRMTLYWCVLTLGPLGVAGSLALTQYFRGVAGTVTHNWLFAQLSLVGAFAVSWLLVFMMYKLIPQAVVAWRSALLGSFVAAVMWEGGKYGFGIYLHEFVGAQKWYGNLALIPLFMLWIYLTWNFVLIGLQIAYVHQFYAALARQYKFRKRADGSVADLRWVLPLAVLLYRRFREGKALTMEEACIELSMPSNVGEYLLRALNRSKITHLVVSNDKTFTLARPPEQITVADLMTAAKAECISASTVHETTDPQFAPGILELDRHEAAFQKTLTLPMLAGEGLKDA